MKRLEDLLLVLRTVSVADISQVPQEEQHLLADNLEELEDRLKAILNGSLDALSPVMLALPASQTIH